MKKCTPPEKIRKSWLRLRLIAHTVYRADYDNWNCAASGLWTSKMRDAGSKLPDWSAGERLYRLALILPGYREICRHWAYTVGLAYWLMGLNQFSNGNQENTVDRQSHRQ